MSNDNESARMSDPVDITDTPSSTKPRYGGAFRIRYVSVPSWFLRAFAKENTALSSMAGHIGFEFQRRKATPRTGPLTGGLCGL